MFINDADGREGWPELAPYDAIHVGAQAFDDSTDQIITVSELLVNTAVAK